LLGDARRDDTYVNPVVAVLLGWLLASEPLTAQVLGATVLIVLAVVLIKAGSSAAATASGRSERSRSREDVSTVRRMRA
jgi:drug/metabolite transporter (DMT)-like permease